MMFLTGFQFNFRLFGCLLSNFNFFLTNGKCKIYLILVLRCLILCVVSCTASLFDSHERIIDNACFTFPKSIEGLWDLLVKLNIFKNIHNGERYLFALLIGVSVVFYKYYSEHIPKNYRNIFKLFFGND